MQNKDFFESVYACLMHSNIDMKVKATVALTENGLLDVIPPSSESELVGKKSNAQAQVYSQTQTQIKSIPQPGRPDKPILVQQQQVPKRSFGTEEGRAAFIHAICHIEFNAINLALDALYRFRDFPSAYYNDWMKVAKEESEHFQLLNDRLYDLGYQYGDFPAHNGLWDMACRTEHDSLHRMALVPRVLEARGLDVTPGIIKRLKSVGDFKTVEILELILHEEVAHVKIGNDWYKYLCQQRALDPIKTFRELIREYYNAPLREPLNYPARIEAGFTEQEIKDLIKPFN
ncbi:FIG00005326: uncharacterized protein [hydrothermal vent metagenome]|uniref:FIG00005326: uncharacterized protein n=1 Tax=hydrothermal vent metagenome TaxID=652676 RepID=A0A3B0XQV5_9ZZZZ